ncbi:MULTISPECIES: DUF6945 domain-containing protein [Enterobacteriaceae]|uniref:DUF6945 domain-containing protein n=1 Tax=Enterobacteriaceae TaxID=543 RepID=UPI002033EAF0|nr:MULTISPECIES: hypothetical protein [Enterobacteriaceae]MCM2161145.1 hypothetical protein [Klebsiella pneumoniae]MCM2166300.1 hypothetical protein [Klebsiella pneumoniae]MCM2181882.1 hypothetical protein [Klebsiella pneumoniae]MCR2773918.1 hypothetical protein [Enterobacter kobei]HCD6787080.1 hypothetical protein [Klebsiella pneumoniae]
MRVKKTKLPQTPPPDEPYTNIEMRLVCADSIRICNTGEVITWKPDMFRVYLYMFNQIKGFEASGGKFFQKREKIWKCCGVSRDRLDKILKSLLKLGLIKDTGERRTAPGAPRGMVVYTAFRLMEVIGNLEIIFAEDDGEPVWDHERASGNAAKKSEEKQGNGNGHEEATEATEPQTESANQPADTSSGQSADVAPKSSPFVAGQRYSVESDDDRTDGNNSGNLEVQIFDEHGVITEAFINSLTGDVAPNRNADGTLQSFRYVYWVARYTQDALDGISTRTKDEYMAEARPWHIPPHLLSTPTTEPEYDEDPKF